MEVNLKGWGGVCPHLLAASEEEFPKLRRGIYKVTCYLKREISLLLIF